MIVKRLLMGLVKAYRLLLSPWLGGSCRFEPTCSAYALQALDQHGAAAGSYLTLHRIARCQPWCDGGHDPVPPEKPRLFSQLLSPTSTKKSS
ncbi:MAG: membrane protein insertion efficiency factor YidD [Burkholderiaceae bacterium]|jgi:putative membrane protein insertion efficiency factor|nr:membrane protein insertion efficiency factor YidD [Burkholderiaceae bacterium]